MNTTVRGIGTDIIETARVMRKIARREGFVESVFTAREIAYCDGQAHSAQHYAARFAAKEAFLKALGTGWRSPLAYTEIEIVNNDLGKPVMHLYGETNTYAYGHGVRSILVSLSHLDGIATAVVALQTDDEPRDIHMSSATVVISRDAAVWTASDKQSER